MSTVRAAILARVMPVFACMLRGVNVGGRNQIKMDLLRALCTELGFRGVQTYVQSGNVVFAANERNEIRLADRIEDAIEQEVGFRPSAILRMTAELKQVVARNPFAKRNGIEPNKFLVSFLAAAPAAESVQKVYAMDIAPEELHVVGRDIYMYFPNGIARPKLKWPVLDKVLTIPATARNWNTVTKLLEIAEALERAA